MLQQPPRTVAPFFNGLGINDHKEPENIKQLLVYVILTFLGHNFVLQAICLSAKYGRVLSNSDRILDFISVTIDKMSRINN